MLYKSPQNSFKKPAEAFMPFGSLLNAWGQANQGKGTTAEELAKVADILYLKAKELVNKEAEADKPTTKFVPLLPDVEL